MPHRQTDAIKLAENILQLLDEGGFVATYKYALLIALLDLCIEQKNTGLDPTSFTTWQIAEKIIEIYWDQARDFEKNKEPLRQNTKGQAVVITHILDARRNMSKSAGLHAFKHTEKKRYESLVKKVEREFVKNPIPRLQKVGNQRRSFLYEITWDETIEKKMDKVSAYQNGRGQFDNLIRLKDGVCENLILLNGLLRPLLKRQWSKMVSDINNLTDSKLEYFLFGEERESTRCLVEGLFDMQHGKCFYTGKPIGSQCDVDHFIPWARYPDNSLSNLVLANPEANRQKRDFLADTKYLEAWLLRLSDSRLVKFAESQKWELNPVKSQNIAHSIYTKLPDDALLWSGGRDGFNKIDKQKVITLFEQASV